MADIQFDLVEKSKLPASTAKLLKSVIHLRIVNKCCFLLYLMPCATPKRIDCFFVLIMNLIFGNFNFSTVFRPNMIEWWWWTYNNNRICEVNIQILKILYNPSTRMPNVCVNVHTVVSNKCYTVGSRASENCIVWLKNSFASAYTYKHVINLVKHHHRYNYISTIWPHSSIFYGLAHSILQFLILIEVCQKIN